MPAPTPIVFRYGDDGLLGQAAASVGVNQGLLERRDRASDTQARGFSQDLAAFGASQNANLAAEAQRQRALELQRAHDLYVGQQRQQQVQNSTMNPTAGSGYSRMSSPLATSIRTAKQASIQTKLSGVEIAPEQRAVIDQLAADDNIPFEQTERVLDDVLRQYNTTQQRTQQAEQFKQRQAEQQKRAADADVRFKEREAGIDKRFGVTNDRSAAREQGVNDRFNAGQDARSTAAQLRAVTRQLNEIEKTASFDPLGDESQFAGKPANMFGMGGTQPDAQGLAAYRQYKQLLQQYETLSSAPLTKVGGNGPAANVGQMSDEELLNALTK